MPEDRSIGAADDVPSFQPTWGPVMALAWAAAISFWAAVVAVVAQRLGLIAATLPDGKVDFYTLSWIGSPLTIACIAIVASRLRANPLDVLALRFPRRAVRSVLIGFALGIVSPVSDFAVWPLQDIVASHTAYAPIDENQQMMARAIDRSGPLPSLALYGLIGPVEEEMMFRGLLLLSFFHTRLWFWGAAATRPISSRVSPSLRRCGSPVRSGCRSPCTRC